MDTTQLNGTAQYITQEEDGQLWDMAVHTQHRDDFLDRIPRETRTETLKKKVIVPVEEFVKVPVVRKEKSKKIDKMVVKGNKLVPVTKYKEVEETVLEVQEEMVNGRLEKRATPVTRFRYQPYRDFESHDVDVVVDVPKEEVMTRNGYRVDKHVVSKVLEIDQDLVYEMRPVLVQKGERKVIDRGMHHSFKKEHGKPIWDNNVEPGWSQRPQTPVHRPEMPRPSSARSVQSNASSGVYVPPLNASKIETVGVSEARYVRPRSASRLTNSNSNHISNVRQSSSFGNINSDMANMKMAAGLKLHGSSSTPTFSRQRMQRPSSASRAGRYSGGQPSASLQNLLMKGTYNSFHQPTFGR